MTDINWEAIFPIANLSRADIKEAGYADEDIVLLTDEDMVSIAGRLEDQYRDSQLYIDLDSAVDLLLTVKRQEKKAENKTDV